MAYKKHFAKDEMLKLQSKETATFQLLKDCLLIFVS
jgi:hypothetical protein